MQADRWKLDGLRSSAGSHLAEQEVDACFLHGEGALFFVVSHCFAHIQRPLLPTFNHTTLSHWHTHAGQRLITTQTTLWQVILGFYDLPCWEETLVTGGKSHWETDRRTERQKEKSINILWVQSYRGIWLKPLQQMLPEMAVSDLPSHLLSKWDAAFFPLPLLPRAVPPWWKRHGEGRESLNGRKKENSSADKTITPICMALITWCVNLQPFVLNLAGF